MARTPRINFNSSKKLLAPLGVGLGAIGGLSSLISEGNANDGDLITAFSVGAIETMLGLATERLSSKIDSPNSKNPTKYLEYFASNAVTRIVDEIINEFPKTTIEHVELEKSKGNIKNAWSVICNAPSGGFISKTEKSELGSILIEASSSRLMLTDSEQWIPYVKFILRNWSKRSSLSLFDSLSKKVAERISKDFCTIVQNDLEQCVQTKPALFASIVIQILTVVSSAQRADSNKLDAITKNIDSVSVRLNKIIEDLVKDPMFNWEKLTVEVASLRENQEIASKIYKNNGRDLSRLIDSLDKSLTINRRNHKLLQGIAEKIEANGVDNHYKQIAGWAPGPKTVIPWREVPKTYVPRRPFGVRDSAPQRGTNFFLHGNPGFGKSTLASLVARILLEQGFKILSFDLSGQTNYKDCLAQLVEPEWLNLLPSTGRKWKDMDQKARASLAWLLNDTDDELHPPFCLIWDNVDCPKMLNSLLERQILKHRGVQIITSRISLNSLEFDDPIVLAQWHSNSVYEYRVPPFSRSEAMVHLSMANNAFEQSEDCVTNFADYNTVLKASLIGEEQYDPVEISRHEKILSRYCWDVGLALSGKNSFELLVNSLSDTAHDIWCVLLELGPNPIPLWFWESLRTVVDRDGMLGIETLRGSKGLELLTSAREELLKSGLLNSESAEDRVHERNWTEGRELASKADLILARERVIHAFYNKLPNGNPLGENSIWQYFYEAYPHIINIISRTSPEEIESVCEAISVIFKIGKFSSARGQNKNAVDLAAFNLSLVSRVHSINSIEYAKALHEYSRVALQNGDIVKAKSGFKRSLGIREKNSAPQSRSMAIALHSLGRVLRELERFHDAKLEFEKALEVFNNSSDALNPTDLAHTYHEYALTHCFIGDHLAAEEWFRRAKGIFESIHGNVHPSVAACWSGLGRIAIDQGRYFDAKSSFEAAHLIFLEISGRYHPNTITTKIHLGRTMMLFGDLVGAERILTEAASNSRESLIERHPVNEFMKRQMGWLSFYKCEFEASKCLFNHAKSLAIEIYGEGTLSSVDSIQGLAFSSMEEGDFESADKLFLIAFSMLEQEFGECGRNALRCICNRAEVMRRSGDIESSKIDFVFAAEGFARICSTNDIDLAIAMRGVGRCARDAREYDLALEVYSKIVDKTRFSFDDNCAFYRESKRELTDIKMRILGPYIEEFEELMMKSNTLTFDDVSSALDLVEKLNKSFSKDLTDESRQVVNGDGEYGGKVIEISGALSRSLKAIMRGGVSNAQDEFSKSVSDLKSIVNTQGISRENLSDRRDSA